MKAKYVLDASALIAVINDETGGEKVIDYLPESMISTVNLSEVATILLKMEMSEKEIQSLMLELVPWILAFDEQHAYQTAQFRALTKDYGLSFGDRACLVLGKIHNIPIVTADKVWSKLNIGLEIILIR